MLRMPVTTPSMCHADDGRGGSGVIAVRPISRRGLSLAGANVSWRSGLDEDGVVSMDGPDQELAALRSRVDLAGLPPLTRAVTEQVIASTAEPSYGNDLDCSEMLLEAAVGALAAGAPVVADGPMVVAGIASEMTICKAGESLTERLRRVPIGWTVHIPAVRPFIAAPNEILPRSSREWALERCRLSAHGPGGGHHRQELRRLS